MAIGPLLQSKTTTGPGKHAGPVPNLGNGKKTFHAYAVGTGAISATVKVYVSNLDPDVYASSWITAMTFTLSGTTVAKDGQTTEGPWPYWLAEVTAISGTGTAVTVQVCE